jgi:hypothetical protein
MINNWKRREYILHSHICFVRFLVLLLKSHEGGTHSSLLDFSLRVDLGLVIRSRSKAPLGVFCSHSVSSGRDFAFSIGFSLSLGVLAPGPDFHCPFSFLSELPRAPVVESMPSDEFSLRQFLSCVLGAAPSFPVGRRISSCCL